MSSEFLFTSESVSEGHPDKVADQISDAVLDACIAGDPMSRVAAETLCTTGLVVLAGEITTGANVDYIGLTRDVLKRIGYDNTEYGIDHRGCSVLVGYDKQSQDIAQGVDHAMDDELNLGAGDQGLMFGYACTETPTLMPAPIYYAHRLMERQSIVRKNGTLPFLRPDAKSQVTLRYRDGKPVGADTIVISSQHAPEMSDRTPMTTELTEATVDRSAAYACRYVAKNVVAAGLAKTCLVQVAYAIGVAEPMNITIITNGTGVISDEKIAELVRRNFDLRPRGIIKMLDLRRPIYSKTAAYGHFGREEPDFTWERTDKAAILRAEAGLS